MERLGAHDRTVWNRCSRSQRHHYRLPEPRARFIGRLGDSRFARSFWRFARRRRPLSAKSIWIWCRLRCLWYRRRGEYERPGTSGAIHQRLVGGPSNPYGCPGSRRAVIRCLRRLAGRRYRRADPAGIDRVNHKLPGGCPIASNDRAACLPARQRRRTRVRLRRVEGRCGGSAVCPACRQADRSSSISTVDANGHRARGKFPRRRSSLG